MNIVNLYFPLSYPGGANPSEASSDPYGFPVQGLQLHDYSPDSMDDLWELCCGWHDWAVSLNNELVEVFGVANEIHTGIDQNTHHAAQRNTGELCQRVAQFLLSAWELQFNGWVPDVSPLSTRPDISKIVCDAKYGERFRGEQAAFDFVFKKAYRVAHILENSFGFSGDVRQLKQRLLTANRLDCHNAPWNWHRYYSMSLMLMELANELHYQSEMQTDETRISDFKRWSSNATEDYMALVGSGCGFDSRLNLDEYHADELASFLQAELHDYPYIELATELKREWQAFGDYFYELAEESDSQEMVHQNEEQEVDGLKKSQYPWDANSVKLTSNTLRIAKLAWDNPERRISFLDASDDHGKSITSDAAKRVQRNFNTAMAETVYSISLAKEYFTILD
ncbi:hypothetical protein OAF74_02200 [bacterium]|nr:hypothetical protein [bacterium]